MPKFTVLTYNLNNEISALDDIRIYINSLVSDIVLISFQEYFHNLPLRFNFKYIYYKRSFGIHLLILSKIKLMVDFSIFCLGPLYCGNKGFIISRINNSVIFSSLHFKDGNDNLEIREKQIKYLNDLIKDKNYGIILAGDFNTRSGEKKHDYQNNFDCTKESLGYIEFIIDFPYTYKYKKDNLDYRRIPSYCDRIIYKNLDIKVNEYTSLQTFIKSDHKPVTLHFETLKIPRPVNTKPLPECKLSKLTSFLYDNSVLLIGFIVMIVAIFIILKY